MLLFSVPAIVNPTKTPVNDDFVQDFRFGWFKDEDEWLDRPQDLLGKYLPNNFYKLMNESNWKEIKHAITF